MIYFKDARGNIYKSLPGKHIIMVKKVYSIDWFNEHFKFKMLNGKHICYGVVNGYDYSFESDTRGGARVMALTYLQRYGHIEKSWLNN